MMKRVVNLIALSLLSVAIAGCSTTRLDTFVDEIESNRAEAQKGLDQLARTPGKIAVGASSPNVLFVDDLWLPVSQITDKKDRALEKAILSRKIAINRSFSDLNDVAERITALTGVPVTVANDTKQTGRSAPLPGATASPAAAGPIPSIPGVGSVAGNTIPSFSSGGMKISYEGELSGFLDIVAARQGVSWEWNGKHIQFFRFGTRTFRIVAIPGETRAENTVSNATGNTDSTGTSSFSNGSSSSNSDDSGSRGGSVSTAGVTVDGLSVWKATEDAVKTMLSANGKVVVTPATGTVTVTDTPAVLARVEEYINEQNAALSQSVHLNVRVLAVDLKNADQYGIDWNLLYNSVSGHFGMGLASAFIPKEDAASATFMILPGKNGTPWAGSQAVISALSNQGRVSNLTSASVTTVNNQPTPIHIGQNIGYLKSSSINVTDGSGATTSLQPGTISTGFSMQVIPHVLDKGKMILQLGMDISSLLSLNTVKSGDGTIQTPTTDTRNFLQRVPMQSGDTLIFAGFEQNIVSADSRGVGSASNPWFGGGITGSRSNSIIVILVTATVRE